MGIKYFILVIGILSCSVLQAQKKGETKFYQNEKRIIVIKDKVVALKKMPFAVSFSHKKYNEQTESFYAVQIAVLKNKSDLEILKVGSHTDEIPFFKSGSGYAASENLVDDNLYIGNTGHHYLYYTDEKNKRVDLLKNERNDYEGIWHINTFNDIETSTSARMSKYKGKELYFVIFKDENLNQIINEGEFEIYTIKLF